MDNKELKVYDKKAIDEMDWRRKDLERHFDHIRCIMSGHANNLYASLLNEDGRIDAVKLEKMIDDMIGALIRYRKNFGEAALSKKLEKWYRSYLYLVITGPQKIDLSYVIGKYYSEKNFSDIYAPADTDIDRKDLYEYIWREKHSWSDPGDEEENFLYYMKEALEALSGKDISRFYTKEEKAVYEELEPIIGFGWEDVPEGMDIKSFLDEVAKAEDKDTVVEPRVRTKEDFLKYLLESGQFNIAGQEAEDTEEDEVYTAGCFDAEWEQEMFTQREKEEEEEVADSIDTWLKRLPEDNRFEKEYLYFRRNYLSTDRSALRADMEHLVDAYLYEQGLNAYSLGDSYGIVDKALSVSESRIYREIIRARNLKEED